MSAGLKSSPASVPWEGVSFRRSWDGALPAITLLPRAAGREKAARRRADAGAALELSGIAVLHQGELVGCQSRWSISLTDGLWFVSA